MALLSVCVCVLTCVFVPSFVPKNKQTLCVFRAVLDAKHQKGCLSQETPAICVSHGPHKTSFWDEAGTSLQARIRLQAPYTYINIDCVICIDILYAYMYTYVCMHARRVHVCNVMQCNAM